MVCYSVPEKKQKDRKSSKGGGNLTESSHDSKFEDF